MTKLQEAIAKVSTLPEATQKSIAKDIIAHVEDVEHLRTELRKGIASLGRGDGREADIEEIIRNARAEYGKH